MENDNNIELLEAYVNGTLTEDQQLQVETRLGNDPSFRQDYEMYQLMLSAITEKRKTELKSYISKNVRVKPAPFFKTPTFYAAAAASVVLCIISYFVIYQKLSEQKTLAEKENGKDQKTEVTSQNPDSIKAVAENTTKHESNHAKNKNEEKPLAGNEANKGLKMEETKNDNANGMSSMSEKQDDIPVESDKMRVDTFLAIPRKIDIPKPKKFQNSPTDLYTLITTGDRRQLEVQLWQSPINYSGYKFSKNLLIIYGKYDGSQVSFQELRDVIYMKYKNDYYKIIPSETYTGLKKETDPKIISDLEMK